MLPSMQGNRTNTGEDEVEFVQTQVKVSLISTHTDESQVEQPITLGDLCAMVGSGRPHG